MKWSEVLRGICDEWDIKHTNLWVDETMIPLLSDIERKGIQVDRENFLIDGQIIRNLYGSHIHSPSTIHTRLHQDLPIDI